MNIIDSEIWMSPDEFGNYLKGEIQRMYYNGKMMETQSLDWQAMERSRVGDVGAYTLFVVCDDEERVPHFHIMDTVSYSKPSKKTCSFHSCLEITQPRYLHHDGICGTYKLSREWLKELIDFLGAEKKHGHRTNWEYLLNLWNDNNDTQVAYDTMIPDYSLLHVLEK